MKAARETLFLVIPVISTTFASMDRLFPFHDSESLGWLFIDEAGQATPQAAVGAIWRARRAVVVGDPLQLEPFTAQDSLRNYFGVPEYWRPNSLSCQRLADLASPLGAWVPTDDEPLWVGSPLRVHCRCDALMFQVSNHVAYHGLMIFGTAKRADLSSRPSMWFDVKSREASDSRWIPEEGDVARDLLEELKDSGLRPRDIVLISPFRTGVRELVQIGREYEGLRAGTIHMVQGKKADVVILVLGEIPTKAAQKIGRHQNRIWLTSRQVEPNDGCMWWEIATNGGSESASARSLPYWAASKSGGQLKRRFPCRATAIWWRAASGAELRVDSLSHWASLNLLSL